MKLKLIALAVSSVLSIGVVHAQSTGCNSSGSTWVGENARNMQPGQAGSSNGSGGGGWQNAAGGVMGGAGGSMGGSSGMGQMGTWTGGAMGGQGQQGSGGGMLNSMANTVGLGSLTSNKDFSLSDAAKLASTATTVYGVAKGDNKAIALGMTGMAASNKFEGQIDNFGAGVSKSAGEAWNNMGSSGSKQAGGYDSEFGAPGDYDRAVQQQSSGYNSEFGAPGDYDRAVQQQSSGGNVSYQNIPEGSEVRNREVGTFAEKGDPRITGDNAKYFAGSSSSGSNSFADTPDQVYNQSTGKWTDQSGQVYNQSTQKWADQSGQVYNQSTQKWADQSGQVYNQGTQQWTDQSGQIYNQGTKQWTNNSGVVSGFNTNQQYVGGNNTGGGSGSNATYINSRGLEVYTETGIVKGSN